MYEEGEGRAGPGLIAGPLVLLLLALICWVQVAPSAQPPAALAPPPDRPSQSTQQDAQLVPSESVPQQPAIVPRLVAISKGSVGRRLWAETPWASLTQNGNLGCAAAVSKILQESGVDIPGSPLVRELHGQLTARGWSRIQISNQDQYQHGDIVYGLDDGLRGHVGIVDIANGVIYIYENSSTSGKWVYRTLTDSHSFVPGARFPPGELYVIRPAQ